MSREDHPGLREGEVSANQVGLRPQPLKPPSAHPQPSAQRQQDDDETDGHPSGMKIGKRSRESVVSRGVQLIDLEDGVYGQTGEEGVESALQILGIPGLEGEHHMVVLIPDAGIRTEHELGEIHEQGIQ